MKLKVYSIFASIDGEVNKLHQGRLSTFIRLHGCNLDCSYCDTKYALSGPHMELTVDEIVNQVKIMKPKKVTITGGEPLVQREGVVELIKRLLAEGYGVTVETNGSLPLVERSELFEGVRAVGLEKVVERETLPQFCWVVDYKLTSSGYNKRMNMHTFTSLTKDDWIKFVITSEEDFFEALNFQRKLKFTYRKVGKGNLIPNFAYSPAMYLGAKLEYAFNPSALVHLMKEYGDGDEVLNVQIHKVIMLDEEVKWHEWCNCQSRETCEVCRRYKQGDAT